MPHPAICPQCGAEVPPKAKACPQCGSDEETGWSDEAQASGLGLPDEDFDYDDFLKREFAEEKPNPRPAGVSWFWWIIGLLVLAAFIWLLLR